MPLNFLGSRPGGPGVTAADGVWRWHTHRRGRYWRRYLLIPALSAFAGLSIHAAMATALFTFAFTGVAGTVMFQRRGSIDWVVTRPVLAGATFFAFIGAWMNSLTGPGALAVILAAVIIFAGFYTLAAWHGIPRPLFDKTGARKCCCSCSAPSPDSAPASPASAVRRYPCH